MSTGAGRGEINGSVNSGSTEAAGYDPSKSGILPAVVKSKGTDEARSGVVIECKHSNECAGCPLIDLDYNQQLATKQGRVSGAIEHYPALESITTLPVAPAEPITGYRGRAKLVVSPAGAIGLYDRSGHHDVVDIPGCRVLAPSLAEVAAALRALIATPPPAARPLLLPYDPLGGGVLRAIDLREVNLPAPRPKDAAAKGSQPVENDDRVGVLVTFVLQRDRSCSREELREAGRAIRPLLPRVLGVAANFHDAEAPQILGSETLVLDGSLQAEDTIGSTYHVASFGSFVQAHRGQAGRVHSVLLRHIAAYAAETESSRGGKPPRVLDLYGGSGAISIALAKAKSRVTMVESFAPATHNARIAAEAQGIGELDVRTGDVAEIVGALAATDEKFDVVVMNPPRRGVSPAARESIARLGAPMLVYVSCDPDTLARDLDHYSRLGYGTKEIVPLDMIPLTEEVESIVVLRRSPPPPPRVFYEDDDVLIVDKGPHEPVTPQPEYTGSLLTRASQIPSGVNALPTHRLESGTSGLCVLAKNERARAMWVQALSSSGRLVYVVAVKGVTPSKGAISRDLREEGRTFPARTRYRRLAVASGHSILRAIPDGGRTHQIRRHLAAIGHPVLGDERYGHVPTNRYFEEKHGLDRSFLHLVRIEVNHPRTGMRLLVESPLPGDLRGAIERATGPSVLRFLEQKHALGDLAPMSTAIPESQPGSMQVPISIPPPSSISPPPASMALPPVSLQMPPTISPGSMTLPMPGPKTERPGTLPGTLHGRSGSERPSSGYRSITERPARISTRPPQMPTTVVPMPKIPPPPTVITEPGEDPPRTRRSPIVSGDDE
ncbi:MAG TPA: pseudouridine synthase [Polyangiaceae bacterium]|jgi:23S rRNA (uracil1939-C5)-methyltransferase|nr:pseudouridine synthase [Polyangiaceae bacterium]